MKRYLFMLMLLAAITPSLSGCFGNFALTRKIYAVNASVPDKTLRSVVTWAFIFVPVYWVSGAVDLFILNTIEFWSGHNPMLAGGKSFNYSSGDQNFKVLAVRNDTTVSYTIDRYRGEQYLDTLVVTSDLSGTHATAAYRQPGKAAEYAALESGDRMIAGATSLTLLLGQGFGGREATALR